MSKKIVLFSFLFIYSFSILYGQTSYLNKNINSISYYIISKKFEKIKYQNRNNANIDSLYSKALRITKGNISEALLALTFACLPTKYFPFTFHFIKLKINIPLPVGPYSIFKEKLKDLPSKIFFDSPRNKFGDRDKLSHLFGNAFLMYNIRFFNISKIMGILVEIFEDSFEISGFIDKRDLIVNYLGGIFGRSLRNNKKLMPSKALAIYSLLYFKY